MKKTLAVIMALSVVVTAALGGCSSASSAKSEDGKTKIRFASWDNAEDVDKQQALVDQFNSSQDKIEVSLEAYGTDYDTKISAGMGSGDTPDVVYMWDYPTYYEGLEPLDPYIEKEGADYKDNFYETLWPYNSKDGAVYGIPVGFTTHALFYNKDMFSQAGVAEPTKDWTWDDVEVASKTIAEKIPGAKGFSFQMKPDPYDSEMYLWSNGTSFTDADGNIEGNLNSQKAVEALSVFQDMEKEGHAIATEKNGMDEFRSGKTAMFIYGAWAVSTLETDGVNFGVVDIPAFAGAGRDSVSILSSSGVSISKDSKKKDAAWEFVKFWTGEEMNKARIGYELPALKSVVESEKILENPFNAPFYSMLEQSGGMTPASFIVDNWSGLKEILDLTFERVYNPSALEDPKTVLDEAVAELQS